MVDGKDSFRLLAATTLKEAEAIRAKRLVQHDQSKEESTGIQSPYAKIGNAKPASVITFAEIFEVWIKAGYPNMERRQPTGESLKDEIVNTRLWLEFGKGITIAEIRPSLFEKYEQWRRDRSKRMKNGRRINMEIITLKKAVHWAHRMDLLKTNPISMDVGDFQNAPALKAKYRRPNDAEELHLIAETIFSDGPRSHVLGFQMLFEAFTGVRTSEALRCQWTAKWGEAGFIDGDHVHLARSKKGVNPWAQIHPALRQLLDTMKLWHALRHRQSPWFFPSPEKSFNPVSPTSINHALSRAIQKLAKENKIKPDRVINSHGMRGFYVTARRSEFVPDGQIASEIGDSTGAAIISSTYGDLPPNWYDSKEGKIGWLPSRLNQEGKLIQQVAWEVLDLNDVIPLKGVA